MKQHLFGDTENTFNLLNRIFNKLLIKNSYFLNTAREVPDLVWHLRKSGHFISNK